MVNYTLHYFNGRGRAEISRLILAAAGIEYTDHRIEEWSKAKPDTPIGQVPYLDIDDHTKLPQSLAIARYLAREYNLVGKNNLEAAKADAVVDTCIDLMTSFYNKVFLIADQEAKEAALKGFLKEDAPKGLENIEKLISKYGKNGFSVGDQLTWADLFIYEITYGLLNYQSSVVDKYDLIKNVRESVEKNERVYAYLKKRPLTPF